MNRNMKSNHIKNLLKKLGLSEKNIKIIDPIIEFKEGNNKINEIKKNKSK